MQTYTIPSIYAIYSNDTLDTTAPVAVYYTINAEGIWLKPILLRYLAFLGIAPEGVVLRDLTSRILCIHYLYSTFIYLIYNLVYI